MKSVALGQKENMKIESRNHIHSSKGRKTVANKLNIWKATHFCKIYNFPFISREGLLFPTGRMGWCGHSALHQIRGSNRGPYPKKHNVSNLPHGEYHSVTRIQAFTCSRESWMCAVKVTVGNTPGLCEVVTWAEVTITSKKERKSKARTRPAPQHSPGQTACLKCFPAAIPCSHLRCR